MARQRMNSTSTEAPLSPASRAALGSFLVLAVLLGSAGNSILSLYVIRHTEMRSLINILLATMAVSDTLQSLLCAPVDLLAVVRGTRAGGPALNTAHSFALSALVVLNVTILVVISVDRYRILVHRKEGLRRCRKGALVSVCVAISLAASCPPLFGGGRPVFAHHCADDAGHAYSLLFSGLLFVLPCGLLLLAYVHIIVAIRQTTRRVGPHRNDPERSLWINVRFKRKTFSTLLCLYGAAVVCRLPLAVSVFLRACPVAHWVMLLTYLNSALNPFIYALKIDEYLLMLTGRFHDVRNQVKAFKSRRSRSQPHNIYVVTLDSATSVL